MQEIFVVIGKRPILGFSKTRLAMDVGEEKAQEIYQCMIVDFFKSFKQYQKGRKLFFFGTPKSDETENYFISIFKELELDSSFQYQDECPFFERLQKIFQKFPPDTYIHLTGTDIPDFPFRNLATPSHTISIGRDLDGGFYYLGGMAKYHKIFEISGGQDVFQKIKDRILELDLYIDEKPSWSDIDTLKDLQEFLRRDKDRKSLTAKCAQGLVP